MRNTRAHWLWAILFIFTGIFVDSTALGRCRGGGRLLGGNGGVGVGNVDPFGNQNLNNGVFQAPFSDLNGNNFGQFNGLNNGLNNGNNGLNNGFDNGLGGFSGFDGFNGSNGFNNGFGGSNGFNNGLNNFNNGNNGFGNGQFGNQFGNGLINSSGAGVMLIDRTGNPVLVASDGAGNLVDSRGNRFSVPRDRQGNPLDRFGNILRVVADNSGSALLVGTDRFGNVVRIPTRDGQVIRPFVLNSFGGFGNFGNNGSVALGQGQGTAGFDANPDDFSARRQRILGDGEGMILPDTH